MTDNSETEKPGPTPLFGGRRLLVVGTGAIAVMHLPFWFNWIAVNYPDVELRTVLTRSAARMVSPHALSVATKHTVQTDTWDDEPTSSVPHVELAEWADCTMVYPACLNFLGRMANGLGDSPTLLALQCMQTPIAVAPSLPPGARGNPLVVRNLALLAERPNVVVCETRPARSLGTGRQDADGAVAVWTVLSRLEQCRRRLSGEPPGRPDEERTA